MTTLVTETPAAAPEAALRHFETRLAFETDCWDVHESLRSRERDFVLLDVRGVEAFAQAHVPGSLNIPHRSMTKERMTEFSAATLFVVYCAGPHCNGANKAAVRLARMGYRVKEMIGGIAGWRAEGFALEGAHMMTARAD
jgi:rhodanese-related sulfurtransferase